MARRNIAVHRLGRVDYEPTHALQKRLVAAVSQGALGDLILFLEHPPTITMGRSSKDAHILHSASELAARGITVHDVGRGGDVTYHGPGQLVAYPIINLNPDRRDVRRYMRDLESVMVQTCARYGVEAGVVEGLTGAWVGDRKIGAIGVRISRWVTMHGLALNVNTELEAFENIVPCGIQDKGVTSLSREVGCEVAMPEVEERLGEAFADIFGADLCWHDGAPKSFLG